MACRWLGSIAILIAGAGLAWGKEPPATLPLPPSTPPTTIVDSSAAPATYQNPTNSWGNPSKGIVYLSEPYVDQSRVWFQTEYLLWWIRPGSLPPVVGTAATGAVATGSLPSAAIQPLHGSFSNELDYNEQSGVRFNAGFWLDESQEFGIDASFFQLEHKGRGATFTSPGDPVIGPTFFDPNTSTQNLILASLPQFTTGPLAFDQRSAVINAHANNRLWGAEVNFRRQIGAVFFADHLDLIAGFRHLQFSEGIDLVTTSTPTAGNVGGATLHVEDRFGVHNQFYGVQLGIASHTQVRRWSFDLLAKLALGDMHQASRIEGSTRLTATNVNIATPTGVLAQPTNIGRPTRDQFAVLPELTFNVGFKVVEGVRLTAGYNFLYLNSVMRAGDLIDGVDARQVRGLAQYDPTAQATRPTYQQHESRFWAQGFNFGLEVRY